MSTETLSKLYLELSQVVPAETRTAREIALETAINEAHLCLCFRYQHLAVADLVETRAGGELLWRVWHLDQSAADHMTSGDAGLYHALMAFSPDQRAAS